MKRGMRFFALAFKNASSCFHQNDTFKTEKVTFNEEFCRAFSDPGGVGGSAGENARVFNENLSDSKYKLLTFTQHLYSTNSTAHYHHHHALKVLRAHGLPTLSLHDVFNATVLAKILYCSPAWSGYCSAADSNCLDAFLRKAHKLSFCADISETVMNRFDSADDAFLNGL